MAALPDFRNRRIPRRADYSILENTDSESDSVHRRSVPSRRSSDSSSITSILCDKCWLRQERKSATKRCLECKENLCDVCARRDRIKRPWWLPCWFVNCWRFLFTKSSTSHSIVDLSHTRDRQTHWVHTQEASSIQRIPRVSRTSLRSNESRLASSENSNGRHSSNDGFLRPESDVTKQRKFGSVSSDRGVTKQTYKAPSNCSRLMGHSQSFDGKQRRKRDNNQMSYRRSRSSEGLAHMYEKEDLDRLEQYNRNWAIGFSQESTDVHKGHGMHGIHRRYSNKMNGKDIDIEFTDKEIKLSVNSDDKMNDGKKRANKCAATKSRRKHPDNAPKLYTEQMFKEVPIWFKKTTKSSTKSGHVKDKRSFLNRNRPTDAKSRYDNSAFVTDSMSSHGRNQRFSPEFSQRHESMSSEKYSSYPSSNTPYIVEEPPDNCPICLEALPGNEARALICAHVMHTSCLVRYLRKMDLDFGIMCPLCNTTTVIKNYYAPRELWYKELPVSSSD